MQEHNELTRVFVQNKVNLHFLSWYTSAFSTTLLENILVLTIQDEIRREEIA